MPSVDHNTMTSSLEVFSTLKSNEDSNESDEESIHLHIDEDDEVETRSEKIDENEEDILNKFDPDYRGGTTVKNIPKDGENDEDKQETEEARKDDNNEDKNVANTTNQEETTTVEEIKENEIQNTKETTNHDGPQETESNIVNEEATSPKVVEEKNDDTNNENVENTNNEKPENNGSKSDNDADDLLDVSKIRDAEEDNADDNVSNEECDEDMNDKIDSDDINNEQTNNKNDEVDIEENNLEMSCNEDDKTPKESNDETEINKDNADKNNNDKENNSEDEEMKDKTTGISENRNSSKRSLTDINDENSSDNLIKRQRLEENLQIIVNKLNDKLSEDNNNNNNNNNNSSSSSSEECQRPIVQSIEFFKDFMKKKNYKVSVYDLEELCLQKSCEAIQYCSKLGDTRHQLQIEEQLVETLRKDLQQVMKQARDLEIVNKKLMADLKQYMTVLTTKKTETTTTTTNNSTTAIPIITPVKPLQPLKITRSVGLQVRFTPSYETVNVVAKRRQPVLVTQQKVTVSNNNKNQKTNAIVNSSVTTQSPPNRQQGIGTRTRNSTGTTTISTPTIGNAVTTTTTTTTTTATTNSIIDLTDEDDKQNKRPSTTNCTTISTQNRSIVARNSLPLRLSNQIQPVKTVPSNLRLTSSSSSSSSSSSATTTTTATKQITPTTKHSMYLVQSISPTMLTSTLSGTKVLLNVQSQNGILNGSTVSVIQKSVPSIQLKPTHTLKATNINGTNLTNCNSGAIRRLPNQHPAPLPLPPAPSKFDKNLKPIPPKPHLSIRKTDTGIILQWKMPYELDMYEVIASYQLFAYQETNAAPDTGMWRRVGDVKALALPMACTLTQFADNNKYYFAVRPVDIHKRIGAFSDPEEISL